MQQTSIIIQCTYVGSLVEMLYLKDTQKFFVSQFVSVSYSSNNEIQTIVYTRKLDLIQSKATVDDIKPTIFLNLRVISNAALSFIIISHHLSSSLINSHHLL